MATEVTKTEAAKADDKEVGTKPAEGKQVAAETKQVADKATKPAPQAEKKVAKPAKKAVKAKRNVKKKKIAAKARPAAKKAATAKASTQKGFQMFNFDNMKWGEGFEANAQKFEELVAQAQSRQEELVKKSQKAAEEMAELTRANIEAAVEAGRIAAQGARDLSGELIEDGRTGLEKNADSVKALAEAKSPTEFFQLQAQFMQGAFDRMVQESSKLTERMIKLSGDAIQPVSNQASVNAEKVKSLMA